MCLLIKLLWDPDALESHPGLDPEYTIGLVKEGGVSSAVKPKNKKRVGQKGQGNLVHQSLGSNEDMASDSPVAVSGLPSCGSLVKYVFMHRRPSGKCCGLCFSCRGSVELGGAHVLRLSATTGKQNIAHNSKFKFVYRGFRLYESGISRRGETGWHEKKVAGACTACCMCTGHTAQIRHQASKREEKEYLALLVVRPPSLRTVGYESKVYEQ